MHMQLSLKLKQRHHIPLSQAYPLDINQDGCDEGLRSGGGILSTWTESPAFAATAYRTAASLLTKNRSMNQVNQD